MVGVGVFAIWIGPDLIFPGYRQHWLFQNAITGPLSSSMTTPDRLDPIVLGSRTIRAVVLVPTLWFASEAGGIRGAAYAQTGVAILVAVPLAAYALHRARVALAPVGLALVRPLGAAVLAAAVAVVVVRFAGTNAFVQLAVAGTAGVLVYVPIAVPREQLRQLWTALRHRQPAGAALAE